MADLLQTGTAWLADQLQASASQTVLYKRSGSTIATLTVTPALEATPAFDAAGNSTTIYDSKFILPAADFIKDSDSSAIEIASGDKIHLGSRIFKVLPGAPPKQPEELDPHGVLIAIYAQEVQS